MLKYIRGSVWWVDLPKLDTDTHIQQGKRPCCIVSNDIGNRHSQIVTVIPFTTAKDNLDGIHPSMFLASKCSYALTEQIITVDKNRLLDFIGVLESKELDSIIKSLQIVLGMTQAENVEVKKITLEQQEEIKKAETSKSDKPKKRLWTPKLRFELLADADVLDTPALVEKWNFKDGKQARTYVCQFKKWRAKLSDE